MSDNEFDFLCNEVLSAIEIQEARLLKWGFTAVQSDLNRDLPGLLEGLPTAARALWQEAQNDGKTIQDILENLTERQLLFSGQADRYRSRFAEAIRLLSHLRQRFSHEDWQSAPRLISDLKIDLQRRRYPRRDIPAAELLKTLRGLELPELYHAVVKTLLSTPEGSFALARFQVEAILQIAAQRTGSKAAGLVIGAGTGAGKTKAFYIPALAEVASTLESGYWVRVLALYPRIELLKDQLLEAYSESRKLDQLLKDRDRRPVALGAYYGDTPHSAQRFLKYPLPNWTLSHEHGGYQCPFLVCATPDCERGPLLWMKCDIESEAEANNEKRYGAFARLRCPTCGRLVTSEQLLLTRDQMRRTPPDILFTTTEMLNRRLSHGGEHALFGLDRDRPPRLILLDEIHTYEGLTGAQVAYVLRRWRHGTGRRGGRGQILVGLSATLSQAERFFATLTGLPEYAVRYIAPAEGDLVEEGIEYNVVVRGDPVAGTSLLSTSVQTVMLLGRILDPLPGRGSLSPSGGAIGHKVFAFTDKLDVINRWYHTEQDAETTKILSQYRSLRESRLPSEIRQQVNLAGQHWWLPEEIGHNLRAPLTLDLTSSQSRGVRADANLVIATSTLEVGYNDPLVGAVVQHKAPRNIASFLQRKGRAGRTRAMRPWTVVVTSAYGRDRWAFQHAEMLYDPVLPPLELPVENYYVRKIQAAFALLDWLALELKGKNFPGQDLWKLLSSGERDRWEGYEKARRFVADRLHAILQGSAEERFAAHLREALQLDEDALHSVLWGEPRALMLEVIPTVLRQLESNWQRLVEIKPVPWTDGIASVPLPNFVPANLFSALNLPELQLRLPEAPAATPRGKRRPRQNNPYVVPPTPSLDARREEEAIGLAQGMVEFAPGHVSKRYARPHHPNEAHWLALPDAAQLSRGVLPLQYLAIERDPLPIEITVTAGTYQLYRPRAYALTLVPREVLPTSSARLEWQSHFAPRSPSAQTGETVEGTPLALSPGSPLERVVGAMTAYLHAQGTWVEVSRLATAVSVDTRYKGGTEWRQRLAFEENEVPAALGFQSSVDALRIDVAPLDVATLRAHSQWTTLYESLGPRFFHDQLQRDVRLAEAGLSTFDITWLWQLELSMVVATAVARRVELAAAAAEVQQDRLRFADRTLRVIFQPQQGEEGQGVDEVGRVHSRLLGYLVNPAVQAALQDYVPTLWRDDYPALDAWLGEVYGSTLGAALLVAVMRLVPDVSADDLHMDVSGSSIWLSEATAGGVGLIAKIANHIAQQPRALDRQLLDTLQHCDRAYLAGQLSDVAATLRVGSALLKRAFGAVRGATDLPTQANTHRLLAAALEELGIPASRELIVALNNKFLRPNSGPLSDELIATLSHHWAAEEMRLGTKIDLRVMAVAAPRIDAIRSALDRTLTYVGGGQTLDEGRIFNLLQSLLWLPCYDSCPSCIEGWQAYQTLTLPSRPLLLTMLVSSTPIVRYGEPAWLEEVQEALEAASEVDVHCEQGDLDDCKSALLAQLTSPVEVGFQLFFPVLERVQRTGRAWSLTLVLRELLRG